MRKSKTQIVHDKKYLCHKLCLAIKPRPAKTVSTWADSYRVLTSKGSGEPGIWRTDRTPYLREIMDELSASSATQRVVLMFAAQTGKTEVGLNWLGYVMHHAPGPMLTVLPTIEVAERWVMQRLNPMLVEVPALREIYNAQRSRDAANSKYIKDFPGGVLVIGGANSPASLASMPIRYVLCDEVDRFPWETGREGDPLGLIDERTKTFPRRKVLLVSTPTIKGTSRIESEYNASDMREYRVPCPHCATRQVLKWRHEDGTYGLRHDAATGETYYSCRECGERIFEHHKTQMLAGGRWVARHPGRAVRGYWLSGLYSPVGLGFTWTELWQKWESCHGDTANLKRFINTTLGETWEERGDSVNDALLIGRLETYPANIQSRVVTAGVDVQKDRLEATIVAWGALEEAWVLDHIIIPGDTARMDVWDDLHDDLVAAGVQFAAIDSGYNTSMVYDFTASRRWAIAIKGVTGTSRPLIEDERKRAQRMRARRKRGTHVEPIGVDQGKALIYSRLKLTQPGAGYIHFPNAGAFDDEYFAQVAAEKLVTKIKGGRPHSEWVQTRSRNEALDCLVYATAAARLSGVDLVAEQPQQTKARPRPQRQQAFAQAWR